MNPVELLIAFATNPSALEGVLGFAGFVFTALDIVLLALFIFTLRQAFAVRPDFYAFVRMSRRTMRSMKDPKIAARFSELQEVASQGSPRSRALAIVELDALVDGVLRHLGIQGEHIADRIERLDTGGFTTIEKLWNAHRLRNEILRNPGLEVAHADAHQAIMAYGAFLRELGVL